MGNRDWSCRASFIKEDLLVFILPSDSGVSPRLSCKTATWINVLWVSNPMEIMLSLYMLASAFSYLQTSYGSDFLS